MWNGRLQDWKRGRGLEFSLVVRMNWIAKPCSPKSERMMEGRISQDGHQITECEYKARALTQEVLNVQLVC